MTRDHVSLTEAEWKIMLLLWQKSPWTMMELTHALEAETGWSKHTVITMLKRMAVKGTVRICEDGPVKTYFRQSARTAWRGSRRRRCFGGCFRAGPRSWSTTWWSRANWTARSCGSCTPFWSVPKNRKKTERMNQNPWIKRLILYRSPSTPLKGGFSPHAEHDRI